MRRFLTVCVLTILLSQPVYAQLPPYKHFKVSDGLASQNVFDCIEDSNGFMWFATMDGLSRFDSHNFKNYYQRDGLNSNYLNSIAIGEDGLFLLNYSSGLNKISNEKIENLISINEFYVEVLVFNNNPYIFQNSVIGKMNNKSFIEINRKKVLTEPMIQHTIVFNDKIVIATNMGLYCLKDDRFEKFEVNGIDNELLYYLAKDKHNNLYASGDNKIYKIMNNEVVQVYKFDFKKGEDKIFKINVDKEESVWFSVMNSGLFRYKMKEEILTNISSKLGFNQFHVNEIYEDSKGDIWVCTFGRGVYLFYDTYVSNYTERDGLSHYYVNAISGDDNGKILIGTFDKLSVLEKNEFTNIEIPTPSYTTYIYDIVKNSNNNFLINVSTVDNKMWYQNNGELNFRLLPGASSAMFNEDTVIVGCWGNEILFVNKNQFNVQFSEKNFQNNFIYGNISSSNRINSILVDDDKRIWFASNYGVSFYENKAVTILNDTLLKGRFLSIAEDKDGKLYAAGENGLFKISDTTVTESLLQNVTVNSIEFDNKDRIWAGSNKGLYMFERSSENNSFSFLNEKSGLTSDDITSLYYNPTDNYLWIGTTNGVTSLDLELFDKYSNDNLKLSILEISSGDSSFAISDTIKFSSDVKEFSITVSSFESGAVEGITYEYNFENDTIWNSSPSNTITFNYLPFGEYDLKLRARDNLGNVSEASLLNFEIETPFEKSTVFYICVAVLLSFSISFGIYQNGKRKLRLLKEKNAFKDQISSLKQKSLSVMMNPHFIFNSLNSIQSFYNYEEKENVNEYIAKLSRLIRMNLDLADRTFISLSEELERLENYLHLEKMRFENKLSYEFWIADDIDPEQTKIPNMILQPFVENAIWHGILKSEKRGHITINVFHSLLPAEIKKDFPVQLHSSLGKNPDDVSLHPDHCIKIEITDNGIGLHKSSINKNSNHISHGIRIIKARLSVLHHYEGKLDLIKLTDRSDLNPDETGTLVEIYLTPNIYNSKR